MSAVNKYGLRRSDLTSDQKRQIRQQAGFGCVVCGNAIGDYEHIDPEFSEAEEHDVSKMAFLCIQCHGKVTRRQLSKQSVLTARENPAALESGFSFEAFDIGSMPPKIHFGPMSAVNCKWAIRVNQRPVFWINDPEADGAPFRLNAEMRNATGEVIFSIIDNEWRTRTDNWDVEVVGPRITIRNGSRQIALVLRTDPPNDLFIERMDMAIEGYSLFCDGENFIVTAPSGNTVQAQNLEVDGSQAAVELADDTIAFGSGGGSVMFSGTGGITGAPRAMDATIRRNSLCRCGSRKRYKHCCGAFRS